MEVLREGASAKKQHDSTRGTLKDYSLKHRVTVEYDMNEDTQKDLIFKLKIDDYEVLLDWEEVQRILRWV